MDIQAEIKWIQNELPKVTDPELIAAFKNLLLFRQKLQAERELGFEAAYERAITDKEAGRTSPHEDVKKKYERWL